MAMLEGVAELTPELLNEATLAWVERDYHRALHSELGTTPLARALEGPTVGRESPGSEALRAAFRMEVSRTQRASRWHRKHPWPALRDPLALPPPRGAPGALCALGLAGR